MTTQAPGHSRQISTPTELGNAISELRSLRRKTQFEVASALTIDRSQLAHLEGGRSGRYLAHLLNILDHLGAELRIQWPADLSDTASISNSLGSASSASAPATLRHVVSPPGSALETLTSTTPTPTPSARPAAATADTATKIGTLNAAVQLTGSESIEFATSPVRLEVEPTVIPSTLQATAHVENPVEIPEAIRVGIASDVTDSNDSSSSNTNNTNNTSDSGDSGDNNEITVPSSAQLTKITNLAMNVMAASQQLSGPQRPSA